ncbi:MAG: hypothetical protein COB96_04685, partial [Planctomycetota bacterium]
MDLAPRHSGDLTQPSLFPFTLSDLAFHVGASADEMTRWHAIGWLSFAPGSVDRLDNRHFVEASFIEGLARSGLSDQMITSLLSKLKPPYCYDAEKT